MTDADRDVLFVGTTAFCEASGEGPEGIRAVVWSIINRHRAGRWYSAATLAACCVVASAYSSWNTGDANRRRALETPLANGVMALCLDEARAAIAGETADPTDGATHYFAPRSVATTPAWALASSGAVQTAQIGNHVFFRNVA